MAKKLEYILVSLKLGIPTPLLGAKKSSPPRQQYCEMVFAETREAEF
jgi:hypothetical protein